MKKYYWFITITAALLLIGCFYWYQWRPSQIIKVCENNAIGLTQEDMRNQSNLNIQNGVVYDPKTANELYYGFYNSRYQECLRENGLEK